MQKNQTKTKQKTHNLEQIDKFLETDNHPRLNQEKVENMNGQSQVLKLKLWLKTPNEQRSRIR